MAARFSCPWNDSFVVDDVVQCKIWNDCPFSRERKSEKALNSIYRK